MFLHDLFEMVLPLGKTGHFSFRLRRLRYECKYMHLDVGLYNDHVQRSLIYLLYRALLGMWWGIMQDQNEPILFRLCSIVLLNIDKHSR